MAEKGVKLLGSWPSPYVIRARIALNIKSVEYEFLEEKFGSKSELLLKSNPVYKKIPVLIHGDKPICESLVIIQYIDDIWCSGPSILPSDPYDRAMARFWAVYIDDKFWPAVSGLRMAKEEAAKNAFINQIAEAFSVLEDAFAKCSRGQDFFGGEKVGFLDIALGCFLGWLRATEKIANLKLLDETKTPGLSKWADKFRSHDAVKNILPETDRLVEVAKAIMAAKSKPPPPSN